MSTEGGSKSLTRKPQNASRVSGSTYSVNTTLRKTRAGLKEEMISKKITEIFKEKEQRMIRTIEATIVEDRLKIYKLKRSEFEEELNELEAERKRIIKRKKNKKERMKLLKQNTRQQFCFIAKALNATVIYYKALYFENDYYRFKKLLDVCQVTDGETSMNDKLREKAQLDQLLNFYQSPFKEDRRFVVYHMAQITRDKLESSARFVKQLFFGKIFGLLLTTTDEKNRLKAFEILCNLIQSTTHRKSLAKEGYFKQIYDTMQIGKVDDKTLEKLSWMTTLICFHPDMIEQIVSLKLLNFIIRLVDNKFSAPVRSNAVLAISLLTYHESLFNELISNGVIDIVMNLCMDQQGDLQVKQFSTLALVHFALSKQSINILIDKGIMDLFNSLGIIGDAQIQTNVSWIFLALCNNGITGKQMLTNGITRDMFLVSCNPMFNQIRHLVIAGFAELGRCTDIREQQEKQQHGNLTRIKEKAIVGMHDAFRLHANETIDILLRFSISDEQKFMITALWALKDYILLNHENLISDLSGVICAFVNGSVEESDQVKTECANAISFLITHQLVFNKADAEQKQKNRYENAEVYEFNPNQNYVLDALMLLSGSESLQVRTRAFSTLSTLSTYASQQSDLMPHIQADITIPQGMISRQYYQFINERINKSRKAFVEKYKQENIETKYAGLYSLLRLAQCPDENIAIETAIYLHQFYYPEHYEGVKVLQILEKLQNMTEDLSYSQKEELCINLVVDECDVREISLDLLNEKFFMFVFQALLYSKNKKILYLLLDVINFYIKHPTEYQDKVINAATILWMLQIFDHSRQDQDLCLLVAKTVFKIVDNHQIQFDYQEMSIIKKFNKALENINKDPDEISENFSDEDEPEQEQSQDQSQTVQKEVQLEQELRVRLEQTVLGNFERQSEHAKESMPMEFDDQDIHANLTEEEESIQKQAISKQVNISQIQSGQFCLNQGSIKISSNQQSKISVQSVQPIESIQSSKPLQINQQLQLNLNQVSLQQIEGPVSGVRSHHSFLVQSHNDNSEQNKSKIELRDALIKSFMVIFTNEKSQHLLLNQDIIDIAFSCLEYCENISIDAKKNLARLISIIFKFPQVQDRILQEKIVLGIVHLLSQDLQQSQIISYALRSCTYISLSYNFVNSPLSLQVLQALTPLMDKLDSNITKAQETLIQSQKMISPAEILSDKDNCVFAIANLLKGSTLNAVHFIKSDGPRKVMQEILNILSCGVTPEKLEIVELCVASIKQLANTKQTFKQLLEQQHNQVLLRQCIKKIFELTDQWYTCSAELLRFKKIVSCEFKENEDKSIKMASFVKIRNNIYYTVVGCFKSQFALQFILDDCKLLHRLVSDLQQDNLNDYIFQHLIMCLQSLMKNEDALCNLFSIKGKELFILFTEINQMDKKLVYIKSIIQAVLRIPEQICDTNPQFFGYLFQMANVTDKNYKKELEDIIENVLWLQTTLLELNLSPSQQQKAINLCLKFENAPVLVQCLSNSNERIILQALKGLSIMSTLADFKSILLVDLGDKLFCSLADIINQKIKPIHYKLEIETNIVSMLTYITTQTDQEMFNTAARRRVVQQGFVDCFIKRSQDFQYQFSINDDLDPDIDDLQIEDIDRITDGNQLIENTMQLIANASELQENLNSLISTRCQMMHFLVIITQQLLTFVAKNSDPPVSMLGFSFGNLKLAKSIAQIFQNLTSQKDIEIQEVCVKSGFGQLIVQIVQNITDYDMHSKLYQSIAELVLSQNIQIAQMAVEQGCYQELTNGAQNSNFHKVRRVCSSAIDKVPQSLIDLNTKALKKRLF